MEEQRKGGLNVWIPLLFAIVLVAGMVLGFNLKESLRNKRDIQSAIQRSDRLEQIIDLIKEKYVDTINSNYLYGDAVNGIIRHLDPHTVYIPTEELDNVTEDLEGSFYGIGVEFSIIRDTVQVTSVIENGPAEKAGVVVGDKFIKVNDSIVAGTNINSDRIIKMLRGKLHTQVNVTMMQPLSSSLKQFPIKRDVIPIYSVDAGIMLDSNTGYIKINRFSASTYKEFKKALIKLKKQDIRQLIIDLRQNPGGYLDAATSIADELLDDEKLIVYTQGVHSKRTDYKAKHSGLFEKGRLAILVDESSASASEILAGAIQDWDRGIIVGRRTYGKGLVQEQYGMDDGSALRLTIARYYTPSGRCIQRSFAKGKEAYQEDYLKRFEDGELTGNDSVKVDDTEKYYTANKRIVHGGGGIKPDIYVPYDTARLSSGILSILYSDTMKAVMYDYYLAHARMLKSYKKIKDFDRAFHPEEELLPTYLHTIAANKRKVIEKLLSKPANKTYLLLQMKAQLARFLFRDNGYYAISAQDDQMVQQAIHTLYDKEYLHVIGR
jgi:carboxyl-terminal processing protease